MVQGKIRIQFAEALLILYSFAAVIFDDGSLFMKVARVLLAAGAVFYVLWQKKLQINTYMVWLLAFAAVSTASILWAYNKTLAQSGAMTVLVNCFSIICFVILIDKKLERVKLVLKSFVFFSILLGIYVFATNGILAFYDVRYISESMSPNAIGIRSAIAATLAFYFLIYEKGSRLLYITAIVLNAFIVILSASRKSILSIGIIIVLFYIFKSQNAIKLLGRVLIGILILALGYLVVLKVPFLYEIIGNRLESMLNAFLGTGDTDASTSMRLLMINWGIEWFRDKPVIGYGITNYSLLLGGMGTSFGTAGTYAHNNYIELLVDLGLIGTITYYLMHFTILKTFLTNLKKISKLQLFLGCIFIALLINDYGSVSYYDKFIQPLIALIWITLCGIRQPDAEAETILSGVEAVSC